MEIFGPCRTIFDVSTKCKTCHVPQYTTFGILGCQSSAGLILISSKKSATEAEYSMPRNWPSC